MTDTGLTARALAFGAIAGAVIAAANVYAGLELAFVDPGTTTIVLVAFALFGAGRRRFAAREVAVAAALGSSAGAMAITAGLVGPLPALALSGHPISPVVTIVWASCLGLLGTALALPFRDSFLRIRAFAFPSARAAGEAIASLFGGVPGARREVRWLALAAALAAGVTAARDGLHLLPASWAVPVAIAGVPAAALGIGIAASPLLVGVGMLAGARTATSMAIGALVAWLVIAPRLVASGAAAPSYPSIVSWTLWPGAALMVASATTSCLLDARALWTAVRAELRTGARGRRWLVLGVAVLAAALVALGALGFGVHPAISLFALVLAFVFAIAAMHATGETDNTPSGPLGGLTQIVVGATTRSGLVAPLHAGGVVNGVATHAAQMLNNWKTGDAVATPVRSVLVAQGLGVIVGAVAATIAYVVVRDAYGLGTTAMPMPGVMSWKATADAVAAGTGAMPAGAPVAALAAAITGVALAIAARSVRLRRYLPSPVAIGIGFILPASLTAALVLGAVVVSGVRRSAAGLAPAIASGLIVGEAFTGVVVAAILASRG